MVRRIRIDISYGGHKFFGSSRNNNGLGVQNAVEKTLKDFYKEEIKTTLASRTDRGVHAFHQVLHFDETAKKDTRSLVSFFNHFNVDVKMLEAKEVEKDFHARFSPKRKTYMYKIYSSALGEAVPFEEHSALFFQESKFDDIETKFSLLRGRHDFRAFCKDWDKERDTETLIEDITWVREQLGPFVLNKIFITGSHFLYSQIRLMMGTCLFKTLDDLGNAILKGEKKYVGPKIGGQGLYLVKIEY